MKNQNKEKRDFLSGYNSWQTESVNSKTKKTQDCYNAPTEPHLFPVFSIRKSSSRSCCEDKGSGTASTEINVTETAHTSFVTKALISWVGGFTGLIALVTLIFGTGVVPGFKPDVFWHEVLSNLAFIGKAIGSILPFFIISVAISAWVTVSGFSQRIKAVFNRREMIAILGAAVVGATIPVCSCGVIPLIAALLASGIPLGPVMAFWISSPLMSPSMFVLTAGVLGMHYAVAQLVAAIMIGGGAGYFIFLLSSRGLLNNQLHGLALSKEACCGSDTPEKKSGKMALGFWQNFWQEAGSVALFLGKWLLVAFIIEALIVHYVDPAWISSLLGKDQLFSIPLATAVGIPVYTSGVGAIPIVQGLLSSGMSHGAALAFLVAGPVTTIPAMTAVFALVKRQTFAIYLVSGIIGSLITGYFFQIILG